MHMELYAMVQGGVPLEVRVCGLSVYIVDERQAETEVVDGGRTVEDVVVGHADDAQGMHAVGVCSDGRRYLRDGGVCQRLGWRALRR